MDNKFKCTISNGHRNISQSQVQIHADHLNAIFFPYWCDRCQHDSIHHDVGTEIRDKKACERQSGTFVSHAAKIHSSNMTGGLLHPPPNSFPTTEGSFLVCATPCRPHKRKLGGSRRAVVNRRLSDRKMTVTRVDQTLRDCGRGCTVLNTAELLHQQGH